MAASRKSTNKWALATFGYIRNITKEFKIKIPNELIPIIVLFYRIIIESKILTEDEGNKLDDMICSKLNEKTLNWNLVWSSYKNELTFDSFWNICNEVKHCIVIIETIDEKNVFGGYTSVGFTKYNFDSYTRDENAFLYSIRNINNKLKPKIFPIKKGQEDCALWYTSTYICCFGSGCGSDIWLYHTNKRSGQSGTSQRSYDMPIKYLIGGEKSEQGFEYKQVEVFQLSF